MEEAFGTVRSDPPDLRRGDLLHELPGLVTDALGAMLDLGSLIVFHSAVIAYLDVPDRERFAALMSDLSADPREHWISNEGPEVLPGVIASGPPPPQPPLVGLTAGSPVAPSVRSPRPDGQCRPTIKSMTGVVGSR